MKLTLFALSFLCVFSAVAEPIQEAAQKEAVRLYPSLLVKDSPLNKKFLEAVAAAKAANDPVLQDPTWILTLAKRAGGETQPPRTHAVTEAATAKPSPTPWTPSSRSLGGPAGSKLGTAPEAATYAIGGTVLDQGSSGVYVRLTHKGSIHKIPKQNIVHLSGHPDFAKLVTGDKVKVIATLTEPHGGYEGYSYAGELK